MNMYTESKKVQRRNDRGIWRQSTRHSHGTKGRVR